MRSTRRARLVLTILLLAAFTLITLDYRSGALGGVRRGMSTVFGPIENAVSHVVHPIGSWFSAIGHLSSYKSDNDSLKREVADLRRQARLTETMRSELAQDNKLLHLAGLAQYTVVPARVISIGSDLGFEWTATIDRGSANGIKPNQTVINGDGLVGRVESVGRTSATILLANDPKSVVGAQLAAKQPEIGRVAGGGRGPMALTLFSSTARLAVGEQLVTYGSSHLKPFVPAVPIGRITSVAPPSGGLGRTATVTPYVDYSAIDIVAVVVKSPKSIRRDALLPASPTPAPTVTVTVTPSATLSPGAGAGSPSPTISSSP